jgi:phosphoenolpyruvate carboxylase
MDQSSINALQKFQDTVGIKFQLYNSLFLSLPFYGIDKTGILLSLFLTNCEDGFAKNLSPAEIIESFFKNHTSIKDEDKKLDLLFRFVQYAERQIVLFDALEDAAFHEMNDLQGAGTLKQLISAVIQNYKKEEFAEVLKKFSVRPVLTAHPTQFYPGSVLGIINDLADAIEKNEVSNINTLLQQLGRTPFFKKQKPTPFDEAVSLIWYLENVFYHSIGKIVAEIRKSFPNDEIDTSNLIKMGFWSGGDRDGNPFVTVETTLKVADALRNSILKCYYKDVRLLKRRLTFAGVESVLAELEARLYQNIQLSEPDNSLTKSEILGFLLQIRETLLTQHNGLFVHLVEDLIAKVNIFGLFFASLDIRQESTQHSNILNHIAEVSDSLTKNYAALSDAEKIETLLNIPQKVDAETLTDELAKDTIRTVQAVKKIQTENGVEACERYIISQCQSALNAIEVLGLFLLSGWKVENLTIDIVPLFETIADLEHAADIMRQLYQNPVYRQHLERRGNSQTIMLGFSDGTKDGGYLMANWSIYRAKDELTALSREFGVNVVFFDGRGGPPARGGGKTHKFFSSMGKNIANDAIQLTIQGQTVSSNFGTIDAAQFNLEQLLNAGISNHLFSVKEWTFERDQNFLMQSLADASFAEYESLKNHPQFLEYLSEVSPLRFYSATNIGSRPVKRGGSGNLTLKDLRAIPFVGAWSQLKQNVPGFYGVGTALKKADESGKFHEVKILYYTNGFFKALIDNCEMAMQKSFFPLTAWLENDATFGEIWRKIHDEFELTKRYILMLSGKENLMSDYPTEQQSVQTRERIVFPLTTIQQYAIRQINQLEKTTKDAEIIAVYEKLAMRCSFGIINAGRNSA